MTAGPFRHRRARRHLLVAAATACTLAVAAPHALADFPYSRPGTPDLTDYSDLYLDPGQVPNDIGGDNNEFKYAATPDPTNIVNNNRPGELGGVRGNHVVDDDAGADTAWMTTTGRPDVTIATLDSGIKWNDQGAMSDLRFKTRLNRGELPAPAADRLNPLVSANCASFDPNQIGPPDGDPYDANDDGVFNIRDYACDLRVNVTDPRRDGPADFFTPQDVLIAFSNPGAHGNVSGGVDDDDNGYVDDVVGWDFLDDDNDPFDDVQYGHGTGEARGSSGESNNGGDAGSCPNCMVIHMRVGDSFVADVNRFAEAVIYATDNDVQVVQEALGSLNNSTHAREAVNYAYEHGVTTIASAADEAAQHNNWPSSLPHVILVNSVTRRNTDDGAPPGDQSYLAFNGCTNFNAKITLAIESTSCSSDAVGVGSGLAGLVYSAAYNAFDDGRLDPNSGCELTGDGPDANGAGPDDCVITPNEVRQVMASGRIDGVLQPDDVNFASPPGDPTPVPEQSCSPIALPGCTDPNRLLPQPSLWTEVSVNRPVLLPATRSYPARAGHDQFYGYGRAQMERAVEALDPDDLGDSSVVPPEVEIFSPEWYEQVDPARSTFPVTGEIYARDAPYTCRVLIAPGHYPNNAEAPSGDFHEVPSTFCDGSTTHTAAFDGTLATISVASQKALFPVDASGTSFAGREPGVGVQTSNGRPNTDPYGFVVKVVAETTPGALTVTGEDQRAAFLHRDQDMLAGFPRAITGGGTVEPGPNSTPTTDGASSPAFADLDGDNRNEMIFGTSDGFVHAMGPDGTELPDWPVRTDVPGFVAAHDSSDAYSNGVSGDLGGAILASVGIGDGDRNGIPEVYAADLEGKIYGWEPDGDQVFEEESNPAFSGKPLAPFVEERHGEFNRTQHGFIGSPVLADLDGDGGQEIVAASMDRHLYAWSSDDPTPGSSGGGGADDMPGFPLLVVDRTKVAGTDPDSDQVTFEPGAGSEQQGAIIVTPAVGDLDGDADDSGPDELPEIVVGTNEEYDADSEPADPNGCGSGCAAGWNGGKSNAASLNLLEQARLVVDDFLDQCQTQFGSDCPDNPLPLGPGNSRVYAVYGDGDQHAGDADAFLPGWPARPAILMTGLLPVVGEGVTGSPIIGPVSCTPGDEGPKVGTLANNGPGYVLGADGGSCYGKDDEGKDVTLQTDVTPAPAYDHPLLPAVGHPAFGTLAGDTSPSFVAPAAGIMRALDLALPEYQQTGQDFVTAWKTDVDGQIRPGYPAPLNDLQFLTGPSVADIDGLPGEEVLEATASKDFAALSGAGTPVDDSWPKVTTDWTVAGPLIGSWGSLDTDADAETVVVNVTRSGYINAYTTEAPACSPASWPRFHHDNANSGDFSRDAVLPGKPADAALASGEITFTAPGDDLMCGDVDHYEVVTSDQPVTEQSFDDADPLADDDAGAAPGDEETVTPPATARRYVGIRAVDDQGNVGRAISVEVNGPGPGPGPGPGDPTEPIPAPEQPANPPTVSGPCANTIAGTSGADKLTGTDGGDRMN